jgi:flavin-dependent dehydrogenase
MDEILLRRASEAGVTVLEQTRAVGLVTTDGRVTGVSFRSTERQTGQSTEDDRATCRTQDGNEFSCTATVTIDATGREHALLRGLRVRINSSSPTKRRASLVAFKAYFEGARPASGACEIYFYRGGYGGLSSVEGGLSNLCFIASARDVRRCRADPERVMREVVCRNRRASYSLATARACSDWFAVSLNGFGRRSLAPAPGLITIGDAASFIDPFTGSGMLMALESGELVAEVVNGYSTRLNQFGDFEGLAQAYRHLYRQRFNARLRVCSMLRRAAFVPGLAAAAIRVAGASGHLRRGLARATRSAD